MDEKKKEKIKFEIEILRLSVIACLSIGGGLVSLVLNRPSTGVKNFFISFGIVLLVFLITQLFRALITLNKIIK